MSSEGRKKEERREGRKKGREREKSGRRKNKITQDKLIVPDLIYDIIIMRNSVL